jgi:hypothetical protein
MGAARLVSFGWREPVMLLSWPGTSGVNGQPDPVAGVGQRVGCVWPRKLRMYRAVQGGGLIPWLLIAR